MSTYMPQSLKGHAIKAIEYAAAEFYFTMTEEQVFRYIDSVVSEERAYMDRMGTAELAYYLMLAMKEFAV